MKRFLLCGVLLGLMAGCGTAGERPPEEAPEQPEPLTGKDLTFSLRVEEADAKGIRLSITLENAWNVERREDLFPYCYQWETASAEAWGNSGATSKADDGSLP